MAAVAQGGFERLAGQTVLVTGGTGFIGGRLVEKLVLECGARVRVLVRDFSRASRIARFPVEMVLGDLDDGDAIRRAARGCAVVFHCAYANRGTPREQWETNVGGSARVADAVLAEGVERMVHISSVAVYGKTPEGEIDETVPRRRWNNVYARSKRRAEEVLLEKFERENLPVVILQPSIVYGPLSNWTVYPLEWLQTGRIALVNGGDGLCNCVYVDDVADSLLHAATRDGVEGEAFLVSSGEPVAWREFWGSYETMLGVCSTVSLPEKECRRRELVRRMTPRAFDLALRVARHPRVRSRCYGSRLWRAPGFSVLRDNLFGPDSPGAPSEKPVHWPDAMQIDQATMRTRLKLDKARAMLGFRPRFDFASGMALTGEWARWAGLLPAEWSGRSSPF